MFAAFAHELSWQTSRLLGCLAPRRASALRRLAQRLWRCSGRSRRGWVWLASWLRKASWVEYSVFGLRSYYNARRKALACQRHSALCLRSGQRPCRRPLQSLYLAFELDTLCGLQNCRMAYPVVILCELLRARQTLESQGTCLDDATAACLWRLLAEHARQVDLVNVEADTDGRKSK